MVCRQGSGSIIVLNKAENNSKMKRMVQKYQISNLKMANYILSGKDMRVSCLKSGEEALLFLKENRPELILLDIHMPGMDGFETLATIRNNESLADIPVIFLTADDDSPARLTDEEYNIITLVEFL